MADDARQGQGCTSGSTSYSTWRHAFVVNRGGEKAVVLLIYIVVYQWLEDSILQPLVYSHAVQLNALVIFIAVLVGGLLAGIPGALLAIPVAQIIRILITEVVAYRRAILEANEPAITSPSQPTT